MVCIKKQLMRFSLLLAFSVIALHADYASALEISCAKFKGQCKSLIRHLGLPEIDPGKYVITDKVEISPGYEAVVLYRKTLGRSASGNPGVFIVDSAGKHVLTLETFPDGEASNLMVGLGKHSEGSLVVIGYEDYGFEQIKTKYLFDLRSRKKLEVIKTGVDVDVSHIIEFNGVIYCVGNAISGNNDTRKVNGGIADKTQAIIAKISQSLTEQTPAKSVVPPTTQSQVQATEHSPRQSPAPMDITILDKIGNKKIERILDARIAGDKLILIGKQHRYTLKNGIWKASTTPASDALTGIREPAWHKPDRGVKLPGYPSWLVRNSEITNTKTNKSYPLPQPTYKLFSQWRAERVGDGYTKDTTSIENEIGPYQMDGGQLWFGISFYDGEGSSGIGGIGSFDFSTRKYKISYLREIAGASSFAILVEPDTVWLGLGGRPEGAEYGAGIARINRAGHSVVRYKAPGIVNAFVRVSDKIFAGTTDGMVFFGDDGRIENIELSINKDGSYSPVVKQAADAIYKE